jgi:phospholipase D1/2
METSQICVEGKNCWRIAPANRAAFLIDADAYFSALASAFGRARRFILISGWQLDSRFRLCPKDASCPAFGDFLHDLVRRNRKLNIYLLIWDFSMIYAGDREIVPLYAHPWRTHRRIHFLLDNSHPLGASHHQKVVVVDDAVAFAGGLDIADRRWDTPRHAAEDLRRIDAYNRPYPPSHDVQLMVDGCAAVALGDLVKDHWSRATGRRFRTPSGRVGDPWPPEVKPDLIDIAVAICRTETEYNNRPEVREVEHLYVDSIQAARNLIYFENQYLSSKAIGDALAARLEEENGPEIIMVLPQETSEWLERVTMAVLRSRLLQRLRAVDRFKRLHVYYPVVPGDNVQLRVHAKLAIVDDKLVRIGSSNLNNRSMGLDTECDLAIEAHEHSTEHIIANFRQRLLAEHLGVSPEKIAAQYGTQRCLAQAIENLSGGSRTLRPLDGFAAESLDSMVPDSALIDPERPLSPDKLLEQFLPEPMGRRAAPNLIRLAVFLTCLAGIAVIWRSTSLANLLDAKALEMSSAAVVNSPLAFLWVLAGYTVGSFVLAPITLLIVATVATFGPLMGFFYALCGSSGSAMVTYGLGRLVGKETVYRFTGSVLSRVQRQISRHGFLSLLFARIVPLAPFAVVNMVAGACQIGVCDFLLATVLGMSPGIFMIVVLADQLGRTLNNPSVGTVALLIALAIFFALLGGGFYRWYAQRPATRRFNLSSRPTSRRNDAHRSVI